MASVLRDAEARAHARRDPNSVYVNMNGPRHIKAADFRPQSRQLPGPRVTVGWLKQRENYLAQHETGRDHRFLLPANVSIRDIVRMFQSFPETIDGFLDKEDLPEFLDYVGIKVKSQREVFGAINLLLGSNNDGLIDSQEIQKFFLAKAVFVPLRRDHDSRRSSRQGLRTARNASREARRRAHATRRIVVKNNSAPGRNLFCNYQKYKKLERKQKKLGKLVRLSGRSKWHSFPKYANMSNGVPYAGPLEKDLREQREKRKRFVGGDFHVTVTSQAKQQEWRRLVKGSGLEHGRYISPGEKAKLEERERKAKFLSGDFQVV